MKIIPCTVDELARLIELSTPLCPLRAPFLGGGIFDCPENQWAIDDLTKMREGAATNLPALSLYVWVYDGKVNVSLLGPEGPVDFLADDVVRPRPGVSPIELLPELRTWAAERGRKLDESVLTDPWPYVDMTLPLLDAEDRS